MTNAARMTISSVLGLLAVGAAGPVQAQEFSRPGATLGAICREGGPVVEADVTAVAVANGQRTATLHVVRALRGEVPPVLAVRTDDATSAAVDLAPGERALFFLEGDGTLVSTGAAGDASAGISLYRIEGSWLGKIDESTSEGRAIARQVEQYLATEGNAAARRAMLVASLSHWNPRIATDASYDLESMGGPLSGAEAAAVIDALDRNRGTFEDLRALVRLVGRTGKPDAVLPLADTLEESEMWLVPEIAAALRRTAGGTNLEAALLSALAGGESRALRAKCAAALGFLGDAATIPALADAALRQDAREVRLAAIAALGRLGEDAVSALEAVLLDGDRPADERRAAAVELAETRAGVARLVALESSVDADSAAWIDFVRSNPGVARTRIGQ
jgi:HEAT repeat protein